MTSAYADVPVRAIFSGKFRRYHGVSWWQQLADVPTLLSNVRDVLLLLLGLVQSFILLLMWRPDVVFTKGGYVCLPVGIAAKLLGIPLVIHDSDAHPGLTNRMLARWATVILTGAPLEHYSYPKGRSHYVGIPINAAFRMFTETEKRAARKEMGLSLDTPLLVVTGGGLGAQRINEAMIAIAPELIKFAQVVHVAGTGQYKAIKKRVPKSAAYQLRAFVDKGMATLLGAADVVVTRAGATTMLELAAVAAPTVVVPNARLTGGHQLKNAAVYEEAGAVKTVSEAVLEKDSHVLFNVIKQLLDDQITRQKLGEKMHAFAKPEAATQVADFIIGSAEKKGRVG